MYAFASLVLLALTSLAQETPRRPSPFPEKNRQKEAATEAAQPSRSRSGSAERAFTRTTRARGTAPAAAAGSTGKACFFASKAGSGVAASGEPVNPDELVAAHATYPLGSSVSVTNVTNGKTVVVRIVDRLPDTRRIISVSEAAAKQLGFYSAGVADVKVLPVREDSGSDKHR